MKKMKTTAILTLLTVLLSFTGFGQNYFTLDHNGTPSLYQVLDSAVAHAQNGDHIYIPGGGYNIGTVTIDKEIHLFGVGYDPDSTTATGITLLVGNLILVTGADSSFLTGFDLNGYIQFGSNNSNQKLDNITITRLKCNSMKLGHTSNATYLCHDIFISECIITGNLDIEYTQNILVELTVIMGYVTNVSYNAVFRNNVFTYTGVDNSCQNFSPLGYDNASNIVGGLFENNIFFDDSPIIARNVWCQSSQTNTCTFNNNFFINSQSFPILNNIGINNVTDSIAGTLVNPCTTWSNNCDFHLLPNTVCDSAGSDGTDIGIYGTLQPFKEGAIPINPHIRSKSITTQDNTIYLNINVSAQDR